jgi:hypothetical protein
MTKIAFLLALTVTAVANIPAHAQRAFVSGLGSDRHSCTEKQPCRTFQQAFDTAPANGVIDVLDPADYGPLTITHGISIQAHGWAGITQSGSCATCAAITVSVTTSDPVMLNGLILDGAGTGQYGIYITSGLSVQILNSVVRHFQIGIFDATNTNGSTLLIEDTIASDNASIGIDVFPNTGSVNATLNRITANKNQVGVANSTNTTIANSVISNNSNFGVNTGGSSITWLAKTVISGNKTGVFTFGLVNSYGDNYINDNTTPVLGNLTPVSTQ